VKLWSILLRDEKLPLKGLVNSNLTSTVSNKVEGESLKLNTFSFQSVYLAISWLKQFIFRHRKYLFFCLVTSLAIFGLSVLLCPVPKFESVSSASYSSESKLLDRHGIVIERIRLDHKRRMLDWIALNNISPKFKHAILAAEDKRFLD